MAKSKQLSVSDRVAATELVALLVVLLEGDHSKTGALIVLVSARLKVILDSGVSRKPLSNADITAWRETLKGLEI